MAHRNVLYKWGTEKTASIHFGLVNRRERLAETGVEPVQHSLMAHGSWLPVLRNSVDGISQQRYIGLSPFQAKNERNCYGRQSWRNSRPEKGVEWKLRWTVKTLPVAVCSKRTTQDHRWKHKDLRSDPQCPCGQPDAVVCVTIVPMLEVQTGGPLRPSDLPVQLNWWASGSVRDPVARIRWTVTRKTLDIDL